MKGEAAFVSSSKIDTSKDAEVMDIFNRQREKDYSVISKRLDELERKISSIQKGSGIRDKKNISGQLNKCLRDFEDVRRIDFFVSKKGDVLRKKLDALQRDTRVLGSGTEQVREVVLRDISAYQGRLWVTRKRPFVDRMASAWLIKRFIDRMQVASNYEPRLCTLKRVNASQGGDGSTADSIAMRWRWVCVGPILTGF